ncbi:hypothetical protein IF2G_08501 [Cordyceps javanica]|nr:hypothetical protein IF2G_08501 [Cordyceps javanica]
MDPWMGEVEVSWYDVHVASVGGTWGLSLVTRGSCAACLSWMPYQDKQLGGRAGSSKYLSLNTWY